MSERGGRRAVLHHEADRYATTVEIRSDRLGTYGRVLEDFTEGRGFDRWLRAGASFFDWIHPRFRAWLESG